MQRRKSPAVPCRFSRPAVGRGLAVAISALALLLAGTTTALAAPGIPLPPIVGGPAFSATVTTVQAGNNPGPPPIDGSQGVAVGDLSGHGPHDLAVTELGSGTVSVLRNDGSGHFTKKVVFLGEPTKAVAIGDLGAHGPGNDIAVTDAVNNELILITRDPTDPSGFTPTVGLPTGNFPTSVAIGDLSGHGPHDLAVVNNQDNTLELYLRNPSDPSGYTTTTLPTGADVRGHSSSVAIGDLSGHGPHDLAVTNGVTNTITLFLKNPTGPGYTTKTVPTPGNAASSVAIGDLGGHGPGNDLAVHMQGFVNGAGPTNVDVFLRDPASATGYTATTLPAGPTIEGFFPQPVVIGDIHGKCLPGLGGINPITSPPGVTLPGLGAADQAIASLRHCLPGLAVTNSSDGTVTVYTKDHQSPTGFTPTTVNVKKPGSQFTQGNTGLAIGDLTGSGKLDLVTANLFTGDLTLLTNTTQRITPGE
jgi:hypothetical protein